MATALSAATIDPSGIEQLRQKSMSVANQLSSTFTQGVVQTAQVLTPDQRTAAAAAIAQARARFQHHGMQGMGGGGMMGF
jgi:Spy/CpxP family protein refolding chaperone